VVEVVGLKRSLGIIYLFCSTYVYTFTSDIKIAFFGKKN